MEYFDIVDEQGLPTGETIERSLAHATGTRHRTAHIWVVRKKDGVWQVLLQLRAQGKDSFPGCYDTSSSGHIQAGDEPQESALRELGEELGIHASAEELVYADCFKIDYQTEFYGKIFYDVEVAFVYIYQTDREADTLTLQPEEVEEARWFDAEYVKERLDAEDPLFCIPREGFDIAYAWCLGERE